MQDDGKYASKAYAKPLGGLCAVLPLVNYGLVERKQYESIPPKVEYSLTEIGKKFRCVTEAMKSWGEDYIDYMNTNKSENLDK